MNQPRINLPPGRTPGQRYRTFLLVAALGIAAVGVAAYAVSRNSDTQLAEQANPGEETPRPTRQIRNVLLISMDTTRHDYLSCYGYGQKTTPVIDSLAEQGVLFEHAISPSPMTLPAHCSMLTGTNPTRHGVRQNITYQLQDANLTLAEILKSNGFATGAVISSHVIGASFGLNQGFDEFFDNINGTERDAPDASRNAINWMLKHREQPFFMFLHFFDPHGPYDPPPQYAESFAAQPHGLYAGEIAHVDAVIGKLLKTLERNSMLDSTLVIVVGDHGEGLGEHGESFHSFFTYQSVVHVPLVMKLPGHDGPTRVSQVVGLIDIVPTVCGLLGIPIPGEVEGLDLSSHFDSPGTTDPDRYIYCESLTPTLYGCNAILGLVSNDWKYLQTSRPELYHLGKDPHELKNLISAEPHLGVVLQDRLRQFLEQGLADREDSRVEIDAQAKRQLEALGYVGGSVNEEATFDDSKPDAKDRIEYHVLVMTAGDHIGRGEFAEAAAVCQQMIKDQPELYSGYEILAEIAMAQQQPARAITLCQKVLELKPDDPDAYYRIAVATHIQGRIEEAIEYYRKSLAIRPTKADAHSNLAIALLAKGSRQAAIEHFQEALSLNPDHADARARLDQLR